MPPIKPTAKTTGAIAKKIHSGKPDRLRTGSNWIPSLQVRFAIISNELTMKHHLAPILLVSSLGVGLFWSGLYSPGQYLAVTGALACLALWVGIRVTLARIELVAIGALIFGLVSSIGSAASAMYTTHGILIVLGWILALLVGRSLQGRDLPALFGRMWAWAGALMVFAGLVTLSYLPAHPSGRLASWIGYPIAMGMLGLLGATSLLPGVSAGKWWASTLCYWNLLGLVLSGSRGLWLVAGVLLAYLVWRAPTLLRAAWWPLVCAITAALWIGPAVANRQPVPAVLAALLACLTVSLPDRLRWSGAIFAPIALGMAPGWGWLLGRVTAIPLVDTSSVERLTFLRDGLRLAAHLPFGAGYHAWTALHLQAASYGYFSAEVHSAPLDLALAFGWVGAAGFLLLVGRLWYRLLRLEPLPTHTLLYLAGMGALALHTLVDWELSYAVFMIPLWVAFGLVLPKDRPAPAGRSLPANLLAGLAMAGVLTLGVSDIATNLAGRGLVAGKPEVARRLAGLAVAVVPLNDYSQAILGQAQEAMGDRDGALASYTRARQYSPYEPWYAELQADAYRATGRPLEASKSYLALSQLWPWEPTAYDHALSAQIDLWIKAKAAGDQVQAAQIATDGRTVLTNLRLQKAKEPLTHPRTALRTDTPVMQRARQIFVIE